MTLQSFLLAVKDCKRIPSKIRDNAKSLFNEIWSENLVVIDLDAAAQNIINEHPDSDDYPLLAAQYFDYYSQRLNEKIEHILEINKEAKEELRNKPMDVMEMEIKSIVGYDLKK